MKLFIFSLFLFSSCLSFGSTTNLTVNPTSSLFSPAFVALLYAFTMFLNTVLSGLQKLFASLSKKQPGWLTTASAIALKIVQFLGSNPTV